MKNNFLANLSDYASRLCEEHQISGISIAVYSDGDTYTAGSGVLNIETGVEATKESVFQIGSITKVFTTTLVMQLVDEGRLDLERPVIDYLCDFKVGNKDATQNITIKQLLNHTNGLEGDFFAADKPSGGNQLARYLDRCDLLPQLHPPGDNFSYSNSGFCIAGRLVEVVTGKSWHTLIHQKIVKPLGLKNVIVNGPESSRYRVARGHVLNEEGSDWELAHDGFPRGMDPVGSFLAMSSEDVLRFGKAHLEASRGLMPDWLSQKSSEAMQSLTVTLPAFSPSHATGWGLGWCLYQENNLNVFGHDGGLVGQCAMLRIVPEHNLIFSALVNCDVYINFLPKLFNDLMPKLVGVDYPEQEPTDINLNPSIYCGHYESMGQEYDIHLDANQLKCAVLIKTDGADRLDWILKPISKECFAAYLADGSRTNNVHFHFNGDTPDPTYLSAFNRLNRRVCQG
jgi:CubicO group peptidase (beta-lactamase class C family)